MIKWIILIYIFYIEFTGFYTVFPVDCKLGWIGNTVGFYILFNSLLDVCEPLILVLLVFMRHAAVSDKHHGVPFGFSGVV